MADADERIERMARKLEEQAQKATELQSAMAEMKGTASSPDGSVTVTVSPAGAVLDLRLSQNATRQPASALQQSIVATIQAATQNVSEQLNNAVTPIFGDQLGQVQEAFQAQGMSLGADAATPSSKPTPPDGDPDDLSGETYLR